MTVTDLPELVPARMLNEYAYCPRLFFLEWVDSLWASNADVAEGDRRHRRVDSGGGAAPLPDEGELKAARSVELSSERLGITAKLDLLEGVGGLVVPVDLKKGHPTPEGKPWDADAVQVCAQVLLLREHGYACERGEIFYAQTRQRVTVEPDPELVARTMSIVADARSTAARLAPPPPLESSPKCPRCSLVGICLPDETNMLARRNDSQPRRLIAADPDAVPLYVTEPGSMVGIDGGRLTVTKRREPLASVRLIDVLHVCAFGNVQVSAQALRSLFARDIDVFHFSYGGWLLGLTTGLPSKNVMLRIRQTTAAARGQLEAPRRMIAGKIRNSRVLLRRNGGESVARVVGQLAELARRAEEADGAAELLGIEGAAARLYFGSFPQLVRRADELPGPAFSGLRNRRPPADAVNCLLSFCYGLLTKEVLAACLTVGFDPYIGLFHRPRFGRPALALDLAEEFRPLLADSTVLTLINNREVTGTDFLVRAGAVALTADGRKAVIRAWERRMRTELRHPMFGYTVSYRRAVELQARILAALLTGELPQYEPLVTR
ncbi:MAG TPA: CRISPR-associated endonuclease Cas1 [Trebonia sp.]|jgi:CRISPR-associated protein Cas1|nr:CRISPR-associated endonuclease Cas1 [Trebonia sp.]